MCLDDFMNTPTFYLISILLFFNYIFCNFRFIVTTFFPLFFYSSQGFVEGLQNFRINETNNLSQKVKTNLNEIKFFVPKKTEKPFSLQDNEKEVIIMSKSLKFS